MQWISGGVTAPQGFKAGGAACGLKKEGRLDLALLLSEEPAVSAGVFTTNLVKGHSLLYTQSRIGRPVRAVVVNSGNANACLGPQGESVTAQLAVQAAGVLGIEPDEVLLASTGVIGLPLDPAKITVGLGGALAAARVDGGREAALAIMTTDTVPKEAAVEFELDGRPVRIGGMAKGSGMIHPNMATLLGFLTTDAAIGAADLAAALRTAVDDTFNAVTVDGDTSPCDSVIALANGRAGVAAVKPGTRGFDLFAAGLREVAAALARMIAHDGEGATKLVAVRVTGARSAAEARRIGRSVGASNLVKTALFGADANWGRILNAIGYAGVLIAPEAVDIHLGPVLVCRGGAAVQFSEEEACAVLQRDEIEIRIDLGLGTADALVWTCDLSYDYVKINGSYRS